MICFYCEEDQTLAVGMCTTCFRGICKIHLKETQIDVKDSQNDRNSRNNSILCCEKCFKNQSELIPENELTNGSKCLNCGHFMNSSSKYCSSCGFELENNNQVSIELDLLCPNCNQSINLGQDDCPNCGENLDSFGRDLLNTCVECGFSDSSLELEAECTKCGAILPI